MRVCTVCHIEKNDTEFYFKNKAADKRHTQCKECYSHKRALFTVEHYKKYGDAYRERARTRKTKVKRERQEQIVECLRDKECESCGFGDIRALDFDHIDPTAKRFGIARAITNGYSWLEIEKEIEKCRILCANCHRIRTAEQYNWRKWHLGGVATRGSAKP